MNALLTGRGIKMQLAPARFHRHKMYRSLPFPWLDSVLADHSVGLGPALVGQGGEGKACCTCR